VPVSFDAARIVGFKRMNQRGTMGVAVRDLRGSPIERSGDADFVVAASMNLSRRCPPTVLFLSRVRGRDELRQYPCNILVVLVVATVFK
jgi:hypothetical protein